MTFYYITQHTKKNDKKMEV